MISDAGLVGVGMDVGMTAVPRHELGGGDATRQLLTRNIQTSVGARPVRVDHSVDGLPQLCNAEVGANGYIAVERTLGFSSVRSSVLRIERIE